MSCDEFKGQRVYTKSEVFKKYVDDHGGNGVYHPGLGVVKTDDRILIIGAHPDHDKKAQKFILTWGTIAIGVLFLIGLLMGRW